MCVYSWIIYDGWLLQDHYIPPAIPNTVFDQVQTIIATLHTLQALLPVEITEEDIVFGVLDGAPLAFVGDAVDNNDEDDMIVVIDQVIA